MQFDAASLLKVRKPGVQPGFLTSLIFRSPLRFAAGSPDLGPSLCQRAFYVN